jgi:hypothetical protein
MQKKAFVAIILFFICSSLLLYAPEDDISVIITVDEICSIGFNSTATITLALIPPVSGGEPMGRDTDTSKLLQYSSLTSSGTFRTITVNWDSADTAPTGTSLTLEATSVPAGCGSKTSEITLSSTAQNLITGIGGCHTGTGANGVTLTYRFNVLNLSQIQAGNNETVSVTFTLTDAS